MLYRAHIQLCTSFQSCKIGCTHIHKTPLCKCGHIYHVCTLDCPEVSTMGLHWDRMLTNTTSQHRCSDIHPSFKLTDVITRECLKNRTWAPVNISQCVMESDSPVVLIVVVSLCTNNTSLVKSKQDIIIQQVCCSI